MKPIHAFGLCVFLCVATLVISCSEDTPTGPDSGAEPTNSDYVTVIITAIDGKGELLDGIGMNISNRIDGVTNRYNCVTNDQGIAVFDSLPPGTLSNIYTIFDKYPYSSPFYDEDDSLLAGHTYEFTYLFLKDPIDLDIYVTGRQGDRYVPLAHVTMILVGDGIDDPYEVTTNADGRAVIENADPVKLQIYMGPLPLERNGLTGYGYGDFEYENGALRYNIHSNCPPYVPIILSPAPDVKLVGTSVRFICEGYDFEDGKLPDDAFTWKSNIDGEFGTGCDITADLSIGFHTITLRATDSSGRYYVSDIQIEVAHYDTGSYFPFPFDGYWKYRFDPAVFDVVNWRGETEHWTLDDMTVHALSSDTRSCIMSWTMECEGIRLACRYSITDHIALVDGQFFVTSTDEQLTFFDGPGVFDTPVEDLTSTTVYTPSYPFLSDYRDPSADGYTETTVTAESRIAYTMADIGTHAYSQNETITVSHESGSPVTVQSPIGSFEAITVTSRIGDIERTWRLAEGIGIVEFDSNIAGNSVSAQLYETNMESYGNLARSAVHMAGASHEPLVLEIDSDEERLEAVRRVLRGYSPF